MKPKLKKLDEQVMIITGASSGIGLATARMAAEQGAKIVAAARNEEALEELINELRSKGHAATWIKADAGNEEDVKRIAETAINEFGGFDTWVNNAAITIFGKAVEIDTADMNRLFDTNYWGTVHGSRAAVKHFKETGKSGALINVGSVYGSRGVLLQSAYSAAKFAVHGWTESLRTELEKDGLPVSVSLIHPGRIDTPFNEHAASYMKKHPAHIGYMYAPEAAAEAIVYCAEHPKRDMYIGTQAKFGTIAAMLAPRLTDKYIELTMYRTHHDGRPSDPPEDSALYQAGYGANERGTNTGWTRQRSLYVKATKHPALTALAVGGLAASIWKAVENKAEQKK